MRSMSKRCHHCVSFYVRYSSLLLMTLVSSGNPRGEVESREGSFKYMATEAEGLDRNVVLIKPTHGKEFFSRPGDSGGAVYCESVGLGILIGAFTKSNRRPYAYSIVYPLAVSH